MFRLDRLKLRRDGNGIQNRKVGLAQEASCSATHSKRFIGWTNLITILQPLPSPPLPLAPSPPPHHHPFPRNVCPLRLLDPSLSVVFSTSLFHLCNLLRHHPKHRTAHSLFLFINNVIGRRHAALGTATSSRMAPAPHMQPPRSMHMNHCAPRCSPSAGPLAASRIQRRTSYGFSSTALAKRPGCKWALMAIILRRGFV